MQADNELIKALRREGLLPTRRSKYETFVTLERGIRNHVLAQRSQRQPLSTVLWFDSECIDGTEDHSALAADFIGVTGCAGRFSTIEATSEKDGEGLHLSLIKDGQPLRASWNQSDYGDHVAPEFVDFICAATRSTHGEFITLSTEDQTAAFVFVSRALKQLLHEFESQFSDGERASFICGSSSYLKQRFGHIQILPRSLYREVLDRYGTAFGMDGDRCVVSAYSKGTPLLALLSQTFSENALLAWTGRCGSHSVELMLFANQLQLTDPLTIRLVALEREEGALFSSKNKQEATWQVDVQSDIADLSVQMRSFLDRQRARLLDGKSTGGAGKPINTSDERA
jgi:hypothetical protein